MKKRIELRPVISVNSLGVITSNTVELPKKNVFVKNKREPYKIENREKYRDFSKAIAKKVSDFKNLEQSKNKLELLARKNSARVISDSFNRIINNSKD